jgi:glycosyltransferase involved in cell wall biosynthesis
VVPSQWKDPAPVVVNEARGRGIPVIGAAIGGIPELIRPGETGMIVRPGDVDALAAALNEMAAHSPAVRAAMGAAGRDWVARDFSPAAHRENLLGLYRSLGVMA